MRLALREMRRRPGRFAMATVILTLIALLLMFLGGLLDGLIANSTGALRAQQADAIVYSAGSQNSLVRSRIEPDVRSAVEELVGQDQVGGIGSIQLGGRLDDRGPRDLVPVVLFGYELAPNGLPDEPPAAGEVYADESLQSEGVSEGTEIRLGPDRTALTIVGFIDDSQYSGQATLWGSVDTWREVVDANRPGSSTAEGVVQALVVRDGSSGSGSLPDEIDEATDGATSSLTVDGAIEALPGVAQQRNTFNQIIGVTVVIAIVVVALFFALLTVERTSLYGVLKAVGASSSTLFAGVVAQAVVVTLIASSVAAAASIALDALIPAGSIPFSAAAPRLITSVVILMVAAIVGCSFSLRRVLKVDPAAAIGGGS